MKFAQIFCLGLVIAVLGACGDSTEINGVPDTGQTNTENTLKRLKSINSDEQLLAYLKTSLLQKYGTIAQPFPIMLEDTQVAASDSSAAPVNYSTTNVQEAQVDELDRLKNNGRYLYVSATDKPLITVYDTQTATASVSDELALAGETLPLRGMYLHEQKLIGLSAHTYYPWDAWGYYPNIPSKTTMAVMATENGKLSNPRFMAFDGELVDSRRIGSMIYLVTRHIPSLKGLTNYPQNAADVQANKAIIDAASLDDFMPTYQQDARDQGKLVQSTDCFTIEDPENSIAPNLISVLAIDLNDDSLTPKGSCFVGQTEALYASTDALYLATTRYDYSIANDVAFYPATMKTHIHKLAMVDETVDYRGSIELDGHLGWQQSKKPFRMSEYNDVLRVITYTGNRGDQSASPATLYTIAENSGRDDLQLLATLPNTNRPAPLGKPGEEIYATRFLGNRGYLVTFRTIDPLYVLDLSDPSDPYIAGELEITGYSDYLHPVSENLLLGIGKDAIPDESGVGDGRGAWYQGVKISLFDISNPQNPSEIQQQIIGKRGTNTAVSHHHHAFTYLRQGTKARFAIPISHHEGGATSSAPFAFHQWLYDGLLRFDLDLEQQRFTPLPVIFGSSTNENPYSSSSNDRSTIIADKVYYLSENKLLTSLWDE